MSSWSYIKQLHCFCILYRRLKLNMPVMLTRNSFPAKKKKPGRSLPRQHSLILVLRAPSFDQHL